MAKSNREWVNEVLDALKAGLAPYVVRQYKARYREKYLQEMEQTLNSSGGTYRSSFPDEATALANLDAQACLTLMQQRWKEAFGDKLGQTERNYASELKEVRNKLAHQKGSFNSADAYRVADTATRLLEAVGSPSHAEITRDIAKTLVMNLQNESEITQPIPKPASTFDEIPTTTSHGLKQWRLVVEPHPDVAQGNYISAEFAADLAQVVKGKASVEYGDPNEFFRRTFLTSGLRDLLVNGIKRLTAQGGDPVVQLQTSFGGGKTHSMLAMYHLCGGGVGLRDIPDSKELLSRVGDIDDRLFARRAVIVGTDFDAMLPRRYAHCATHTLWGEIAYQLGGLDGYRLVEQADIAAVSPGAATLDTLLDQFGPALIIIDELVAFARNLYGVPDRLPSGTFESVLTFVQSLTEAVKRSSDALLLVSVPKSEIEIGGAGGQEALRILSNTIGRVESIWKPVTSDESFEIVRRRLFSDIKDEDARRQTVNAFMELYAQSPTDYPTGVTETTYRQRMLSAYPIHPELFDRLYYDWSTLENFQRTRGVLRLMANVIKILWRDIDPSPMIMPSTIPLWKSLVRDEILRYLPSEQNWTAIVETDVDGDKSKPREIEREISILQQYFACRRVARAIFMGSAPSATKLNSRGLDEKQLHLATVQPGEPVASYNDALRRMTDKLTYLYNDNARYWYDTRPTVNRTAKERSEAISEDALLEEAINRLRNVAKTNFPSYHVVPQESADVPDDDRLKVIVLSPIDTYDHKSVAASTLAVQQAKAFVERRGQNLRQRKNMLVFIAADAQEALQWAASLRDFLAWKSIDADKEMLNLDQQQAKQVATNLKKAEEVVQARLQECYSWIIYPAQANPPSFELQYKCERIKGSGGTFYQRAYQRLTSSEALITVWDPDMMVQGLGEFLWEGKAHLTTTKLWANLTNYCYLPRLLNREVLKATLEHGVSKPTDTPFGYASHVEGDTAYVGLVLGKPTTVDFDGHAVIVRPDVTREVLAQHTPPPVTPVPTNATGVVNPPSAMGGAVGHAPVVTPTSAPRPVRKTRFHASVKINPTRPLPQLEQVVVEVLQHLTSLQGAMVEVTLDIAVSRPDGFDEKTVMLVRENSTTLKFDQHSFED